MGIIVGGVGGAQTFSSASGGKVYGYNNLGPTTSVTIARPNPSRQSITFHNPGPSDIFVGPLIIQNAIGTAPTTPSDHALVLTSGGSVAGCWRVYGNGGSLTITGECQGGWQAIAVSGADSGLSFTVMETNV